MKTLCFFAAALLLAGCATLFDSVVTITQVRDSAMKELAALHARGMISPETDARIERADANYRLAAEQCRAVLMLYKETGDATDYQTSLVLVKEAMTQLLDLLAPLITRGEADGLRSELLKANQL